MHHHPGRNVVTNPYTRLLCDAIQGAGASVSDFGTTSLKVRPDIVHVHWPEVGLSDTLWKGVLRTLKLFGVLKLLKLGGTKVVWTAHNLRPHERKHPRFEAWLYRTWFRLIDGIFLLSKESERLLLEAYPQLKEHRRFIVPHGDYRPVIGALPPRSEIRTRIGVPAEAVLIGNFGGIRGYKNIPLLCKTFREVAGPSDWLFVAGICPEDNLRNEILQAAQAHPQIILEFRRLEDSEIAEWSSACDLMAFPYSDILNSGSLLFALTVSAKAVAPRLGSLPELQEDVGHDWVYLYDGEFGPQVLKDALNWAQQSSGTAAPKMSRYDWDNIGVDMIRAYELILRSSKS